MVDLDSVPPSGAAVEYVTLDSQEGLEILRHSTAHLMAQAILELFPGAQLTIGPPIDSGFYYDIDLDRSFVPEDLKEIEKRMSKLAKRGFPIERDEIDRTDALKLFEERGESYKIEMINELPAGETISIYRQGDFVDLCRGPHMSSTSKLKHFRLLSVAGAYWRGDEKNKMLQRIYGTSYPGREDLEEHLKRLEEAKARDHRVLGKQLGLFLVDENAGPGLIYWQPKGNIVRKVIERFWDDEHIKREYQLVTIPHIARDELFKISGHYDFYRENMYVLNIDEQEYVLKPMNCPGHILIYQEDTRSYRDLPYRLAEMGTVYRYERSGVLHGMLRVRGFTQDDAHIFCTPEQAEDEVIDVIDLARFMLETFGYEKFEIELSVHDPENFNKYAGTREDWAASEEALKRALETREIPYKRIEGEAAFYGPKIDIKMFDALGRGWQGPTIQFDFNLPKRFNLRYVGSDGERHLVVMIHRTVLGSMERFVGGLIEHYAGAFPTWLAPVQAKIMTITDAQIPFGKKVAQNLRDAGYRVESDFRNEKIGKKIREAQLAKVPYMLVIGAREMESSQVALRVRGKGDVGVLALEEVMSQIRSDVESRAFSPGEN
ncbi:MAG: threonine--tRNA ligase [Nitrospinota bacterium]|nr:threonine--tRNA ligase [Nitrospinota bacterium]MDP7168049.1 threonine--tRNA ligase [Nitrospinota bacterium]MDP7371110.1 threonine--tRNA ligase [Nitrospinota bacterium]MDP7502636.1 threonine--tRNA ligase [Nitrospinota bacterium]MDP7662146.1 threonine--tRNA ligase [Nitrospinota bacterium]